MTTWDVDAANRVLADNFAVWVRALDLVVESVSPQGAVLRMRFHDDLCREGGIVSGQAIAALADTAMVIAVVSASGGYRPMATIDLHTTFIRAVRGADVLAEAEVIRLGRTMAFARVSMFASSDGGGAPADARVVAASAVGTFALP